MMNRRQYVYSVADGWQYEVWYGRAISVIGRVATRQRAEALRLRAVNVPPSWLQVPEERNEQTWFAGLQHAPSTSPEHTLATHGVVPVQVPFLPMQSQLVEVMHVTFRQQFP